MFVSRTALVGVIGLFDSDLPYPVFTSFPAAMFGMPRPCVCLIGNDSATGENWFEAVVTSQGTHI